MIPPISAVTSGPSASLLRRAELADAAALAEFAARAFTATYARPAGGSDPRDVAAYVATHFSPAHQGAELGDPALETLLAVDGTGRIVGYAQLRRGAVPHQASGFAPLDPPAPDAWTAGATVELARLYVDHERHGNGLGTRLLDAGRTRAAGWGAGSLWLSAYQENARALAFYRKHGARILGTGRFQMGGELQHDWVLVLPPVTR